MSDLTEYILKNDFTDEEKELLKRLAPPPKCMHPLEALEEMQQYWKCNKCGMVAKMRTIIG